MQSSPLNDQSANRIDHHPATPAETFEDVSAIQVEFIDLFVHLFPVIGMPKSIGEIYGFLFVSANPVTFDAVVAALKISTGSASTGLRVLRTVGAVRTVYINGYRRDHYLVETCLAKLLVGFLRENFDRHFFDREERLTRLNDLVGGIAHTRNSTHRFLSERVETLRTWHLQTQSALPRLLQILAEKQELRVAST